MDFDEVAQMSADRGGLYRFMAAVFYTELNSRQIEALREAPLPSEPGNDRMERGASAIARYFRLASPDVETRLRVDYARVFLGAGVYEGATAVPFESVYTSEEGLMMQESRDQVVRMYREDGFDVEPSLQIPEDHLAFELEYVALLCDKTARTCGAGNEVEAGRLLERQHGFIENHLLNWMGLLAERVESYAQEPFYPAFMQYCMAFIESDAAALANQL